MAALVDPINRSAFSCEINLCKSLLEKCGRRRLRLAENTMSNNQKTNVGIATSITIMPIK